jgi:hypothetical protein
VITLRKASLVALTTLLAVGAPGVARAGGDYGPDTCLTGWVWRDAFPGDHVCVTGATRSQAAADNAAAASRRNPAGGDYGPDTCLPGWVWREANPADHVCVTPQTRSQTAADNAQADNRRASLKVWLTSWYPGPTCTGDVCSTTSDADIPRFRINGDHFNLDTVAVGVYRSSDGRALWSRDVRATSHAGYVAGSFGVKADVIDCATSPRTPINAYVQAYDHVTTRRSTPIPVRTGCTVL